MTAGYTIWIPFDHPPRRGLVLDEDLELEIAGHPAVLTKHLRHKGLEITGLTSEEEARAVLRHVGAALMYVIIGRYGMMRIDLDPVPLQYDEGDPILYWDPYWEHDDEHFRGVRNSFDASRTAIFPSHKRFLTEQLYIETSSSHHPKDWLGDLQEALAEPSLKRGIVDERVKLAAELFCASAFEISHRAEFLTLCVALEVLAPQQQAPVGVAQHLDSLIQHTRERTAEVEDKDVREALRALIGRLKQLKLISHTQRIGAYVNKMTGSATVAKQAVQLYSFRGRMIHEATEVSSEDVFRLQGVVSRTLLAAMRG